MVSVIMSISKKLKNLLGYNLNDSKRVLSAFKSSLSDMVSYAKVNHRFKSKSGKLTKAINSEIISKSPIVGKVFINNDVAPYGKFVHQGTKPHVIYAKDANALSWMSEGKRVFAKYVFHPGTEPDPFIDNAVEALTGKMVNNILEAVKADIN